MTDEITREMFQHSTVVIAGLNDRIEALTAENERLREALGSIARNSCCDNCQEAALVARAALGDTQ